MIEQRTFLPAIAAAAAAGPGLNRRSPIGRFRAVAELVGAGDLPISIVETLTAHADAATPAGPEFDHEQGRDGLSSWHLRHGLAAHLHFGARYPLLVPGETA